MAAMELDQEMDAALNKKIEETDSTFSKKRSKLLASIGDEIEKQPATSLTRWSKLINDNEEDSMLSGAAATRARQTKARLDDLETEMEELAERQAKRERRAAALRALVNESIASSSPPSPPLIDEYQRSSAALSSSSKKISMRNERTEKHVTF